MFVVYRTSRLLSARSSRSPPYFASDGTVVIHPEPARFFEVPIMLPLPEDLNFIP